MVFNLVMVILLFSPSGQSPADSNYEYDQCVLENLQGVKYDWVTSEITRICRETYLNMIPPSKNKRRYNQCLLTFLPGVESEAAGTEIKNSCSRRYLK